ncbi:uncharacterized protein DEA37_0004630, partial [Paragonimus westermani]
MSPLPTSHSCICANSESEHSGKPNARISATGCKIAERGGVSPAFTMAVGVAQTMPPNHFIEEIGKIDFQIFIFSDVNDPEYVRQMLRPPVIKEDVKLMQQRARVSLILRSPFFRRELEKIVASQMKDGCLNANVAALMQILDYFTPHTKFGSSNFTR